MRSFGWLVWSAALSACGDDGGTAQPDAAMPDAPSVCPAVTAMPLPAGMHKLYLSIDGVTLTKGQCDDSKTNCTELIMPATVTVPAFYPNLTNRQANLDIMIGYVQRTLAPYSVDVVTTRPTSGDYWMLSMGGNSADIIGNANVLSVSPGVCDANNKNMIGLVFEVGGFDSKNYASTILSDFGALVGLAVTIKDNDCMCRSNGCTIDPALLCTYGTDVPVNTAVHGCGRTTQDEPMLLTARLGCR